MLHQRTISSSIFCSGVGLHTGKIVDVKFIPAEINYGIRFIRTDLKNTEIYAKYPNVTSDCFATKIFSDKDSYILTIEHVMAALWFLNITNIRIEINGEEMPAMDGSSEYFLFLLESAGVIVQEEKLSVLEILKEFDIVDENKRINIKPNKNLAIDYHYASDYDQKIMPDCIYYFDSSKTNFKYDVSRARTFSTIEQVRYLQQNNLIKGGNLLNGLVFDKNGEHKQRQRYKDEIAKHKVLDCIGDFYLSGYHIHGYFECFFSGHKINQMVLEKIFSDKENYQIING